MKKNTLTNVFQVDSSLTWVSLLICLKKVSQYTKTKYTIATSSGTSALHLVLRYFNLGPEDEVLVPSLTYVATANAVTYCGATPNFLDIERDTLGVCPKKIS